MAEDSPTVDNSDTDTPLDSEGPETPTVVINGVDQTEDEGATTQRRVRPRVIILDVLRGANILGARRAEQNPGPVTKPEPNEEEELPGADPNNALKATTLTTPVGKDTVKPLVQRARVFHRTLDAITAAPQRKTAPVLPGATKTAVVVDNLLSHQTSRQTATITGPSTLAVPSPPTPPVSQPSPVRFVLNLLSAVGLRPEAFPPNSPLAPIGQLLEFVYAGLRRVDRALFDQAPVATSQPISPEEAAEFGTDPKTGVITGRVAYDADDELEFDLIDPPDHGTVEFRPDGTYTYTPFYDKAHPAAGATVALAAAAFTPETDTFTVRVREADPNNLHLSGGSSTFTSTVTLDVAPNLTVTETIPTGPDPSWAVVSKDGSKVYIAIGGSDHVRVFNTADNTDVATIPVGREPKRMTMNPAGTRIYVLDADDRISVIDISPETTPGNANPDYNKVIDTVDLDTPGGGSIGPGSQDLAVSPDGTRIYVTNFFDKNVSVVNATDNSLIGTFQIADGKTPAGIEQNLNRIEFSPVESRHLVYIADVDDSEILVIDTDPTHLATYHKVIKRIPVTGLGTPQGMAISDDGNRLFVAENGGTLQVIDTNPTSAHYNEVINTIDVGNPGFFQNNSITLNRSRIYLTDLETDTVIPVDYDVDTNTLTVLDAIPLDGDNPNPFNVAVTPDGTRLYVPLIGYDVGDTSPDDSVAVISILVPEI